MILSLCTIIMYLEKFAEFADIENFQFLFSLISDVRFSEIAVWQNYDIITIEPFSSGLLATFIYNFNALL